MLAITVGQAKQAIKDKKFIKLIYKEHTKNPMGAISVNKAEFTSFVKVYLKTISDSDASEFFNFLN